MGEGSVEALPLSLGCADGEELGPVEVDGSALGSSVVADSEGSADSDGSVLADSSGVAVAPGDGL